MLDHRSAFNCEDRQTLQEYFFIYFAQLYQFLTLNFKNVDRERVFTFGIPIYDLWYCWFHR